MPDRMLSVNSVNTYPDLELAGVQGSFDEAGEVEKIIVNSMLNVSGINGLFVISGGQAGIEAAFNKLKLDRRPHTIIYDLTPKNKTVLEKGVADFLLCFLEIRMFSNQNIFIKSL